MEGIIPSKLYEEVHKKKCKKDRKKKKSLCQKTCCELGFPV